MMRSLILMLAVSCSAAISQAVIVGTGDGTQNTTGTGMSSGWDYVGTVDGASGVYLRDGWVLTAAHVGSITPNSTTFRLSGTTYTADTGATRLRNSDNSVTDLQLFHLKTSPALTPLPLASSTPAAGTEIFMVGYGRTPRNISATYYDVNTSTDPYTWTVRPSSDTANAGGFGYGTSQAKRWGTNTISGTDLVNAGHGDTSVLLADFYGSDLASGLQAYLDGTPGTTYEAILSSGDSGGGVFDSQGVLVGINNYLELYSGQPANTAVFGNLSDMADISVYRSQILAVIPEPAATMVLSSVVLLVLSRRARASSITDARQ